MKRSIHYAVYPTEGITVGRALFARYVKSHINSLIAAKNPAYDEIIAETNTIYDILFGTISEGELNKNDRISLTKNVKAIRHQFNIKIDGLEEVIEYKFHKNSPVYFEVFAHGVTPYKEATLADIVIKMELAERLAAKYEAEIGDTYSAGFTDVRTRFIAEIDAQGKAAGEVKNIVPDYEVKKQAMDKQLLKNICIIILQNLDNPTAVASFFDEHLIFPKRGKKENGVTHTLALEPGGHKAADITFTAKDTLLFANTGLVSVHYFGSVAADSVIPASTIEILPGDQTTVTASGLGAPANKYVIFVNKDTSMKAEVQISLV